MTGSAARPVAGENDLAQNPFNLAAEHALGGWQLNGIATVMSGTPFTVFDSHDVSVQGGAPAITGFSANRPNLVSGQNPNAGSHSVSAWLNASAFQAITQDPNSPVQQFGTAGRNIATGPAYRDWDFSAFKNIRLAEGKQLQFRAELFNFLNHANYRLPDSDISSTTFNYILEAQDPREIQLALKFLF